MRVPGVGGARIGGYLTHWSEMSDADLTAIVAFLKTIPAVENEVPRSSFTWSPTPGAGHHGSAIEIENPARCGVFRTNKLS